MLHQHEIKLEYQKWDYITLADFRSRSCWNYFSYFWLWFLAAVAVSVYASDTFTAVNLLAYDKWSGDLKPPIPFDISKWIFAGCILFSWALCIYEWVRALRVINRGNVAESYLDPLAVVLQSMRLGGVGKGWRRFLVFAALTKSKKGADYVALFAYFQFKAAIRILLAEGPRQAINAMTLYSVMKANLIPTGSHAAKGDHSGFEQFWINVEILYNQDKRQAVIISTMLFTLVIFVFSALSLAASVLLYIGFLWHYIPRQDGSLGRYCRRKVNTRLERIVNSHAKQAIEAEEAKHRKAEEKANGTSTSATSVTGDDDFKPLPPGRQPTLPDLVDGEAVPLKQPLTRTSSASTSPPPYGSPEPAPRPPARQPTLPDLADSQGPLPKPGLVRVGTDSTVASNVTYGRPPPVRQASQSTVATNVAFGPPRPPPPIRSGSQSTVASNVSFGPPLQQPADQDPLPGGPPPFGRPGPPPRSYTQSSSNSNQPLLAHQSSSDSLTRNFSRRPIAPPQQPGPSYEMSQQQPRPSTPTGPPPPRWPSQDGQQRTASPGPRSDTPPALRPGMRPLPSAGPQPAGPPRPDSRNGRPFSPHGPSPPPGQPGPQGRVGSPAPGGRPGPPPRNFSPAPRPESPGHAGSSAPGGRPGPPPRNYSPAPRPGPPRGPPPPMQRPADGYRNGPQPW